MQPRIVPASEWEKSRKQFLIKEKEFTRLRDELSTAAEPTIKTLSEGREER
ncbi:MAG: hypothetical protein JWN45_2313 [Acidobacteriaceae bacterium]|nr:hypothetical protein [Acidobacteriaceae bacterium]